MPLAALAGSPFDTYFVPGLILFGVLGLGPVIAARLAWLRHPLAPIAAFIVGAGLLIWVAVEIAIIGYSNEPPLQGIYGILGVAILLVATRWLLADGLSRLHHRIVTPLIQTSVGSTGRPMGRRRDSRLGVDPRLLGQTQMGPHGTPRRRARL